MKHINEARYRELQYLQNIIGYKFKNKALLNKALTHSSFLMGKEDTIEYNERLEFLGDSILNLIISIHLYRKCKNVSEGQLTRIRANIVCEQSLFAAANKIELGKFLLLSKGEENTGGRNRASILADAYEALIAAIYLDGGMKNASKFVLNNLEGIIGAAIDNKIFSDYKSYLQEYVQKSNLGQLEYKLMEEYGPDHNKTFEMALYLDGKLIGAGKGQSKKDAQQSAAKNAIESMGIKYE